MKYTVLTFNIDGYETIHEIPSEAINQEIEYIYVTNDNSITSNTWTVVYDDSLSGSNFNKCWQVRYNPFKYAHTDTVMKIDGSMGLVHDVMPIFELFEKEHYDAAVMIHPTRNTMVPEYQAWVSQRGYPIKQAERCLNFLAANGYDPEKYKGLYQYNFMIQRNDAFNNEWNRVTYEILKALAPEGSDVDRLDQTLGSFVLNKFFNNMKIMPVGQYICNGMFFNWYVHGTDNAMNCDSANTIEPCLFNRTVYLAPLWT